MRRHEAVLKKLKGPVDMRGLTLSPLEAQQLLLYLEELEQESAKLRRLMAAAREALS